MTERGAAAASAGVSARPVATAATRMTATADPIAPVEPAVPDRDAEMLAYYEARAPEYDDWYLRRGRYERGAIHDAAWNAELDLAGRWLDALPISRRDRRARGRHRLVVAAPRRRRASCRCTTALRPHWTGHASGWSRTPARPHPRPRRLGRAGSRGRRGSSPGSGSVTYPAPGSMTFLGVVRRWLKPGGIFAFIDSRPDPQSSAVDHPTPADDASIRRLDDGREFTVVKVYYEPAELEAALARAGFDEASVTTTGRFFLTGSARAREG